MKQHYEKVKHMSLALQQKEDARADMLQRLEDSRAKEDDALSSKRSMPMPVVYASAAVYCSVLFCVSSIIFKFY